MHKGSNRQASDVARKLAGDVDSVQPPPEIHVGLEQATGPRLPHPFQQQTIPLRGLIWYVYLTVELASQPLDDTPEMLATGYQPVLVIGSPPRRRP